MKTLLDEKAVSRTIKRISHEIIEKNKGTNDIVLVGIKTRGIYIAKRIAKQIQTFEDAILPEIDIDITPFRDDTNTNGILTIEEKKKKALLTDSIDIQGKTVILVDDVMYTGRTCRAAIDAIFSMGRPHKIQFAVLIDRGHRELPLRPDFVGKNIPTSLSENVKVYLHEIDEKDMVILQNNR